MQRAIEEAGIPTIIIAALPPVVRQTGTPRAVAPLVPMGANAGGPHNVEQQTQIVKATLEQLEKIETPGKIVPFQIEKQSERSGQHRKHLRENHQQHASPDARPKHGDEGRRAKQGQRAGQHQL